MKLNNNKFIKEYIMYYKSKRNDIKKWIFNSHSKIYLPILLLLCILIIVIFENINVPNSHETYNSEETSTAIDSNNGTTSSTNFVADNNSYLIKINKSKNFITIFKLNNNSNATPFKTFRCSVNSNVPIGNLKISEKFAWRLLDTNQYAQYTSRIGATVYIHSVPYSSEKNSSLIIDAYNKLGSTATIGSIYLEVSDSKWIYENCKNDTAVEVYENPTEEPAIAIADKTTLPAGTAYDPSDTGTTNKIVQHKIDYLQGVKDKKVAVGTSVNLWEDIYAVDLDGNDITSYISISGSVNTAVAGKYTITYNLIDSFGTIIAYNSIITVY